MLNRKKILLWTGGTAFVLTMLATPALVAGPQDTGYGPGALYQIELSANIPGPLGGGVWLWLGLYPDGSVDYAGSDCGHGGVGAAADVGDAFWRYVGDQIEIDGVILVGLDDFPTTIVVPAAYGHYTGAADSYMTFPPFIPSGIGFTQLQVAR